MQITKRLQKGLENIDKVSEGVMNYHFPKNEIEEVAKLRTKQCIKCVNFIDEPIKELQTTDKNISELSGKSCGLCFCVLSFKLRTKIINTKNCPLKND